MLLGARCPKPVFIPVPMDMGLTTPCHVDDLLTSPWFTPSQERPEERVRPLHRQRHVIDTFPSLLACDLHAPFYVYTNSQIRNTNDLSNNNLINRLSDGHSNWKGDILIVKGSHQNPDIVTDMLLEDVNLVKLIIMWYVHITINYSLSDLGPHQGHSGKRIHMLTCLPIINFNLHHPTSRDLNLLHRWPPPSTSEFLYPVQHLQALPIRHLTKHNTGAVKEPIVRHMNIELRPVSVLRRVCH